MCEPKEQPEKNHEHADSYVHVMGEPVRHLSYRIVGGVFMHGLPSIRLNRHKLKRAVIILAAGLLIVLLLAIPFVYVLPPIRSSRESLGYRMMVQEHYHPVWKDLALRRFGKGDPLKDVLRKHPPMHRDDFGRYTELYYSPPGSQNTLGIVAKDGKLIAARAGGRRWQRTFFETPEEEEAFSAARAAYLRQKALDRDAFRIHSAVRNGQDVFLARLIKRRTVPVTPRSPQDVTMAEEMREIYGQEYLDAVMTKPELTVEVTEVLSGDLQPGTIVTFPGDKCSHARPDEEAVFLHLRDMRLAYPQYPARETYFTVPREVVDWYQSLTQDQVKELEARRQAEWAKWGIDVRVSGTAEEGP
jgi:hypothetical protein